MASLASVERVALGAFIIAGGPVRREQDASKKGSPMHPALGRFRKTRRKRHERPNQW